ncbi:procathepsin L-like [Drosophila eugracilis]|uniref:procathepsin L-like n=1 Tax=Drosophila eugracilis TaxID=29029 RepID=UPI0007E7A96B|nr:procathepsin L-like [Drosophila eugracilis]
MKILLLLPLLISTVSGQGFGNFGGGGFGGFGGATGGLGGHSTGGLAGAAGGTLGGALSNVANAAQGVVSNIASIVPKVPLLTNVQNFDDFLSQTGKTLSAAERSLREGAFTATKNLVNAGNEAFAKGLSTFEMAVNAFADLTNEEFLKQKTGRKRSPETDARTASSRRLATVPEDKPIPESFDWRKKGGVTPVKNQGTCGSCWTFATTGAIEGHTFAATGTLPNLSEQNLVDCGPTEDFSLNGCDGGFQEAALCWIHENQMGVPLAENYPYVDKQESCKFEPSDIGPHMRGFGVIPPGDEELMKKVVATLGPLACTVSVTDTLKNYKRGIYDNDECNQGELNHAILVVGYGSENGLDYWIVKNSWDDSWGEEGYFRLLRGKNFCQIAAECSYPLITHA